MKDEGARYYEIMEKMRLGTISEQEKSDLNEEMNAEDFGLFSRIEDVVNLDDSVSEPSSKISENLMNAHQAKHSSQKVKKLSFAIPSIPQLDTSNWLNYSMKIAAVGLLLVSLKMSFNPEPVFSTSAGLLADTIQEPAIDSSMMNIDSLRF